MRSKKRKIGNESAENDGKSKVQVEERRGRER